MTLKVEEAVVLLAFEKPASGQARISNELRKKGLIVSPGCVRIIWFRHGLETFKKRLRVLEAKVAAAGRILIEDQLNALVRVKRVKEAHSQIETEHPGYLGAQDTFYVCTLKGAGRID